jgi:AFG3 family protein
MFRRILFKSGVTLFRRFSSGRKPPAGFEKFFKKKEDLNEVPKINIPDLKETYKLDDKKNDSNPKNTTEEQKSTKTEENSKKTDQEVPKPEAAKESKPKSEKPREESKKDERKRRKPDSNPPPFLNQNLFLYLLGAGGLYYLLSESNFTLNFSANNITYQQLISDYLNMGRIRKLLIEIPKTYGPPGLSRVIIIGDGNQRLATVKVPDIPSFLVSIQNEQLKIGKNPGEFIEIEYSEYHESKGTYSVFLFNLVVMLTLIMLARNQLGKGGAPGGGSSPFKDIFNFNKQHFKVYGVDKKVEVSFKDVAGQGQAKKEITEFVEFLKNPEKFKKLGARMPRGALLVGPPGTGKTLLAKASAGEAGVPFFSISGSEFVEMFVGVGASRVRELFKQAREKSPSIIFIDEIDAVGRKRDDSKFRNDERDTTLNQLLVEMDGFATDSYVIVMAATNRQDTLDSALLRPGRFDRIVEVSLPDIEGRQEILKVHLNPIKLNKNFDKEECSRRMAALTPGFSGADLSQLCNEAAILAARNNREYVERVDFEMASEKVMLGLESSKKLTPREKKIVSYHEAGHAVSGWFLEGADPVIKVSILPRTKGSLGFAQNMPKETPLYTQQEFMDKICMILGGRVSEQIFFGSVTNGASDDLKKATQLAQTVVETFGMSEKAGLVSYNSSEKYYSEATRELLDSEVRNIINLCLARTTEMLESKKDLIIKLAETLIEKEGVNHSDLVSILGERPFDQTDEYKKFISEQTIS